jgi:hypothetical protein
MGDAKMSNSIIIQFKGEWEDRKFPELFFNLYSKYRGHFSNFKKIVKLKDKTKEEILPFNNFKDILNLEIDLSKEYELWIFLDDPCCSISFSNKSYLGKNLLTVHIDESFFDKNLYKKLIEFAEYVIKFTPSKGFIFGNEAFYCGVNHSLYGLCDKSKDEILEMIQKDLITEGIKISKKEIVKEIENNTKGFQKFADNYFFVNFIEFRKKPDKFGSRKRNKFMESVNKS